MLPWMQHWRDGRITDSSDAIKRWFLRYIYMEVLMMIAGLLVGALLNYWTRKNGHPK